ncbi:MAG TPA: phage baseplate protein [Thermoanaerobaculia bacterium]|jgi:uncharacterized protein (UPF0212 family)
MPDRTLTPSELLSIWERGVGQRPSGRALALLEGDATGLPVGRRDALLLDLREQIFGNALTGITSCPACGEEIELSFAVGEVRAEPSEVQSVRVVEGEYDLEARLPTSADLAAIETLGDLSLARETLFERCVGVAMRDLPSPVVDSVIAAMAAADPQADVQVEAACPSCGEQWREPFDIASYLFSELSVFARRLLSDVHELAAAYGWSERDILALSPARRTAYLEMLR